MPAKESGTVERDSWRKRVWRAVLRLRPEREERMRTRYYVFALLEQNLPRVEEFPGQDELPFGEHTSPHGPRAGGGERN